MCLHYNGIKVKTSLVVRVRYAYVSRKSSITREETLVHRLRASTSLSSKSIHSSTIVSLCMSRFDDRLRMGDIPPVVNIYRYRFEDSLDKKKPPPYKFRSMEKTMIELKRNFATLRCSTHPRTIIPMTSDTIRQTCIVINSV